MKVIDGLIEVFVGTVGLLDFEGVKGFGVDDAEYFVMVVDNWEIREA